MLCDIREEPQCEALIHRAMSELGRIDILVNNAAYQMSQPDGIEAITTEQFDRVMKTNLYGMFWLSRAALAYIPRGGSIINTASVQGYQPSPHLLDYAMTKSAIISFTHGLAQMVAERHPRQCRRPRAGLDAVDPGDDARRDEVRQTVAPGPSGPAGRDGSRLRLPRLTPSQLHHRGNRQRHWRHTPPVSRCDQVRVPRFQRPHSSAVGRKGPRA